VITRAVAEVVGDPGRLARSLPPDPPLLVRCLGLERVAVWGNDQLVDRLMTLARAS